MTSGEWIDTGSGPGVMRATSTNVEPRYVFAVITKVPATPNSGNLALVDELFLQTETPGKRNDWHGKHVDFVESGYGPPYLALRKRVFNVGEILILDGGGREVGYPGRKPSKWSVEVEEFDSLDDAARRALEVLNDEIVPGRRVEVEDNAGRT